MIIGIGIDIVEVERIKKIIHKYDTLFMNRIYTPFEIDLSKKYKDNTIFFAGRWATKEAFSKAIKTGIGNYCKWNEINVLKDKYHRPIITITGDTKNYVDQLKIKNIHISITHNRIYVYSNVILER